MAPENHVALYSGEVDLIKKLDRPIIAHGKAVIAADHHALRPHLFDYEFHSRLRVGDGVIGKALQIGTGSVRQVLQLVAYFPALIEAANQYGQHAARVRQAYSKFGMTVEHSTENQVASRDRGVKGIAHQVREKEGFQAITTHRFHGMQKHGKIEGLNARQDRREQRIVEIVTGYVRTQIDAAHAGQFASPLKFAQRVIGIEHG